MNYPFSPHSVVLGLISAAAIKLSLLPKTRGKPAEQDYIHQLELRLCSYRILEKCRKSRDFLT